MYVYTVCVFTAFSVCVCLCLYICVYCAFECVHKHYHMCIFELSRNVMCLCVFILTGATDKLQYSSIPVLIAGPQEPLARESAQRFIQTLVESSIHLLHSARHLGLIKV